MNFKIKIKECGHRKNDKKEQRINLYEDYL